MASILERVRPAVLLTMGLFRERDYVAEGDALCLALGITPLRLTLQDGTLLRLDGPLADGSAALCLDEQAHALATTGSEGIPKLALYTLAAACKRARAQSHLLALVPEDILLVLSVGTGPARAAWLAAPVAGSCVVGMPVFRTDAALDLIERERASIVCGTPAQLAMLAPKLGQVDTSSVRIWYTAVLAPTEI